MSRLVALAAAGLALAPGVVGALDRTASGEELLLALAADVTVAWLVVRELATTSPPATRAGAACDLVGWFAGCGALAGTTLLSCPLPRWLGGDGPVRHAALAASGAVAAASVLLLLVPRRRAAR